MKALFGVVSLLVALAVVGMIAARQLKAVGKVGASATEGSGAVPQMPGSGNVAEQSRQMRKQVADDVAKTMSQGAAARREEADKP